MIKFYFFLISLLQSFLYRSSQKLIAHYHRFTPVNISLKWKPRDRSLNSSLHDKYFNETKYQDRLKISQELFQKDIDNSKDPYAEAAIRAVKYAERYLSDECRIARYEEQFDKNNINTQERLYLEACSQNNNLNNIAIHSKTSELNHQKDEELLNKTSFRGLSPSDKIRKMRLEEKETNEPKNMKGYDEVLTEKRVEAVCNFQESFSKQDKKNNITLLHTFTPDPIPRKYWDDKTPEEQQESLRQEAEFIRYRGAPTLTKKPIECPEDTSSTLQIEAPLDLDTLLLLNKKDNNDSN